MAARHINGAGRMGTGTDTCDPIGGVGARSFPFFVISSHKLERSEEVGYATGILKRLTGQMMGKEFLEADALEMASILRSAKCIERHTAISFDILAEILTALCTDGKQASANTKGYDVESTNYGRIEVKSRKLGTDGPFPRVTLSPNKLKGADWFMAVRWTRDGGVYAAIMLPKTSVAPLFEKFLQTNGRTAHIHWEDWKNGAGQVDLSEEFRRVIADRERPATEKPDLAMA